MATRPTDGSPIRLLFNGTKLKAMVIKNKKRKINKKISNEPSKSTKQSNLFDDLFPNISKWLDSYGWIEIGNDDFSP